MHLKPFHDVGTERKTRLTKGNHGFLVHHATTQTEHQVQSGLLLDIVVRKGTAVPKLLAREDQALLIRRNTLLVLDLGLHVLNGVVGLDLKGDGLTGQSLHENLHTTTKHDTLVQAVLALRTLKSTQMYKPLPFTSGSIN